MNTEDQMYAEGDRWLEEHGFGYVKIKRVSQGHDIVWDLDNKDISKPLPDEVTLLELKAHLNTFSKNLLGDDSVNS